MMFSGVEVRKVTTNSARDYVRVHIFSRHLIQKKYIYETEKMLKEQLFARTRSGSRFWRTMIVGAIYAGKSEE